MGNPLEKLTIRGFKSIRNLEDFELKSLNILIGANGAGKSNFIAFFRMLRSFMGGTLNDYVRENGGISDLLYNGRKTTKQMEFEALFGERGYRFTIKPDAREGFETANEARYYPAKTRWWRLGDSGGHTSLLAKEAEGGSPDSGYSKPVFDIINSWTTYHFHDTGPTSPMRHAEIVEDCGKLRSDASNIAPFLLRLKNEESRCYKDILNTCRLVAPFLDDFLLEPEEFGPKTKVSLTWRTKGSDYPMQPYHLSDGSIRFICLAAALLQPNLPSTLIMDEPELGLHPEAIGILAELIEDAAKRTQVIVATQSPLLLDGFSLDDIVVVNRKNGESSFERLEYRDFNILLEEYSLGELWAKNDIQGGVSRE